MKSKTIADIFDFKKNSFTIVGLISSLLIIYFHCYPLYYGTTNPKSDLISTYLIRGTNIGAFVVPIFFITSGFLVTFSLQRSKSSWDYIWKRIKRIVPGLFFVLLGSVWFIVPPVSSLGFKDVIFSPTIYYYYIFENITFIKNTVFSVVDAFSTNPYPNVINGSIWTLKHQLILYIGVLIIYKIGILKNKKIALSFWVLSFLVYLTSIFGMWNNVYVILQTHFYKIGILNEFSEFLKLQYFFFSGVMLNIFKNEIKVSKLSIGCMVAVFIIFAYVLNRYDLALMLAMPYLAIVLCCWKKLNIKIDLSYEIYIVAFPVQQLIMYFLGYKLSITMYVILSIIGSIIVAYILKQVVTLCFYIFDQLYKNIKRV